MKSHFIYCPRSGSRIFSPGNLPTASLTVPVVVWANESVHVIGRKTEVFAAKSGEYYRREAKRVATVAAETFGGVAYDSQGAVGVILDAGIMPPLVAFWAARISAGHRAPVGPDLDLFTPDEEDALRCGFRLPSAFLPSRGPERLPWTYRADMSSFDTTILIFRRETEEVVVTAPVNFRWPHVYGANAEIPSYIPQV